MKTSIVNFSSHSDEVRQEAIRAINRQVAQDFKPHRGIGATARDLGQTKKL